MKHKCNSVCLLAKGSVISEESDCSFSSYSPTSYSTARCCFLLSMSAYHLHKDWRNRPCHNCFIPPFLIWIMKRRSLPPIGPCSKCPIALFVTLNTWVMSVGEGGFSFPSDAEQERRGPLMAIADVQIAYLTEKWIHCGPSSLRLKLKWVMRTVIWILIGAGGNGVNVAGGSVIYSVSSDVLKFCMLTTRTAFQE